MELEGLLRGMYELLGKGELEQAVKLLDSYVFEKHASSNELIGDVIQLRRQYSTIQNAKLASTLMYEQITVLEAQLTDAITIFLSKLRDYETNAAVRAERSGQGMLMHNIPQRMPMGLPTRCTIRIGAIKEALMKGMEKEEFAKVEQIKVSKLMEVQLLSEEQSAFDIKTVNRSEQEVDFDNFAQWRYDVTPLRQGQFSLTLKISTVKYIDGKDRYAEDVYDITVVVETKASHFDHLNPPTTDWKGVAALGAESEDKGTGLLDLLKENQKGAIPVIPPTIGHEEAEEPVDWPKPDYPKNVQPPPFPTKPYSPPPQPEYPDLPSKSGGNTKLITIIAATIAIVGLVAALAYYFGQPDQVQDNEQTVELKFFVDKDLEYPVVRVNGTVVDAEYELSTSTITVKNLTLGEQYTIEASNDKVYCTVTVTVGSDLLYQTNAMQCPTGDKGPIDNDSQGSDAQTYEWTIYSPSHPFETLKVDGEEQPDAKGQTSFPVKVKKGLHNVEATLSDGNTFCKAEGVDVQANITSVLGYCVQLQQDSKQDGTSASYTVQVQVDGKIYKYSKALIRPMVDGKEYDIKPGEFVEGFAVFTIPNVASGVHTFSLTGVTEKFVCFEIPQDVQQDLTLRFDCHEGG